MLFLKQSTASQSVLLGPFIDSTDGATAETGLTIANTDIRLSKNGGNMAAKNSGGGTHDENGWYTITLDATDTDTVGRLQISCKVAGALAVFMEFQVVEEAVAAMLFDASALGYVADQPVNTTKVGGTTQTARDLGASVLLSSGTGTGQISLSSGAVLLQATQTGVTIPTVTSVTNGVTLAAGAVTNASLAGNMEIVFETDFATNYSQTTNAWVTNYTDYLGAIPAAAIAAGALDGKGNWNIGKTGYSLTAVTGLGAQTANITGNLSGSVGSVTGAVGSVTGAVASVTGAVGSVTGNVGGNVTGSVGSLAAQAKADVNTEVVDALATDTYAEPGQGAPGATISLAAKINYLYKAWRNRSTQNATTYSLYADDATTVDQKATVSDNGTVADKGEVITGP